tara:strand:- start:49 stop:510 length:462 start_codon:yes stop_codon:yes gene_type:complete
MKTVKEMKYAISLIQGNSERLVKMVGKTGVDVVKHAERHGDITLASLLVNKVAGSVRKQALVVWISDHSPLNWNDKEQRFTMPKNKDKRRAYLIAEMEAVCWTEYTKEPEVKPLDIQKRIEAIVKAFDKAKEEGRDTVNDTNIQAIRSLVKAS